MHNITLRRARHMVAPGAKSDVYDCFLCIVM